MINKKGKIFIIASIYRHPSKNDSEFDNYMNKTLGKIIKENKLLFITGDFNYNLLNTKKDTAGELFLDTLFTYQLQPNIVYPTRIVDNARPTLIDNRFSNYINDNNISGNLLETISDHLPNFMIIPDYLKSELKVKYKKRDYSNFNEKDYIADVINYHKIQNQINMTYFMST